ncbi:MAG: hypothetical protein VYB54_16700 [Pseudomonadota bacterium]|nr:hypothetical protein [Pseudomonadota bacterium]
MFELFARTCMSATRLDVMAPAIRPAAIAAAAPAILRPSLFGALMRMFRPAH